MDFANEEARLLFLKYASPCADTLVKRNMVSKKFVENLRKDISGNRAKKGSELFFKTAKCMCEKIAKKLKNKTIDKSAVRRYFLFEHDKIVDKRYRMFIDFDTLLCRTYPGKVLSINNKKAVVHTAIGRKKYNMMLTRNLEIGDSVIVHRNFIVEKINESLAKRLWKLRENYFKSSKAY